MLLLLAPRVADACSPVCKGSPVVPNADTQRVPTNTKIWLLGPVGRELQRGTFLETCNAEVEPRLETVDGQVVPTQREGVAGGVALVPERPLELGQRYRVPVACQEFRVEDVAFTVTEPEDTQAPKPPTIELGAVNSGSDECGSWNYRELTATGGEPLYVVQPEHVGESITAELTRLGRWYCAPVGWPGEAKSAKVRFAAMDLAGNQSAWTEPEIVRLGCGCRADQPVGSGGLLAAWILAGAALLRRRRQ